MGSGNRLAWGFLPSADPRGRACRLDRGSAARKEPLLGGRKPTLPAGQPPGTDPQTFEPPAQFNWYGRQLACLCVHAYTDTIEKPTMSQPSSKIERPSPCPLGESVEARIARTSTTPRPGRLIPRAGSGAGGGTRPGRSGRMDAERAGGQLLRRPPARRGDRSLPVVGAEVVLLERHRLAGALAEGVGLRLGVGAGREGRRAGVVGRLDPDVPVHLHAGAGRDELADDDVLLQAQERVR